MLRLVELENFFSFCDKERLVLRATKNAPDLEHRLVNPYEGSTDRVPVVAAIFGANASGKSNFLRGVSFLAEFASGRVEWKPGEYAPLLTFNSEVRRNLPTRFYAEFDGQLVADKPPCLYSYELQIQNAPPEKKGDIVLLESLKYAPKGRFRTLFERKKQEFTFGREFGMKSNDLRIPMVSSTASSFAVFATFNHDMSKKIVEALRSIQTNFNTLNKINFDEKYITKYYHDNPAVLKNLQDRIKTMDFGIESVDIGITGDGLRVNFKHVGHDLPLSGCSFESKGTQNFYNLFPSVNYVLQSGGLAILDELDSDLHPLLVPEILRWFHDPVQNPSRAQLIMTCHNASILEYLIKEEVFFTEKDEKGCSHIYALQDIQGVRRGANIYAKYLSGIFGATPKIG